jgi:ligand-binding sensor domain-containing protein/serine phosphatase RsbU (regulator of sigma subunit)
LQARIFSYIYFMLHFRRILPVLFLLFFFSCSQKREGDIHTYLVKNVISSGSVIPKDSTADPEITPFEEKLLEVTPAGQPEEVAAHPNVTRALEPGISPATILQVCVPGKDTFSLPEKIPASDSSYLAGTPEFFPVKDGAIKDLNSQNFISYGKREGLKHNCVHNLVQDKDQNLWIGTSEGITKYDGTNFTHYTTKEGLVSNITACMLEDSHSNLWLGTVKGLCKYDGKQFTVYPHIKALCKGLIQVITEDKKGNIWIGTRKDGVYKYDASKVFTHYTVKEGLPGNDVHAILADHFGNVWFGAARGGISKLDGTGFTHFAPVEGLNNNYVWQILEDKNTNLWIGTGSAGIFKFDGKTFAQYTRKQGLATKAVLSICQDHFGNLWFGTPQSGAIKFDGTFFSEYSEKEGLSDAYVHTIFEDHTGNVWIGTNSGGISKYSGETFTSYTGNEGLSAVTISGIRKDEKKNIWISTDGDGLFKYDGNTFAHFTQKQGLENAVLLSLFTDKAGFVWVGTGSGGVTRFDGKAFSHFTKKTGFINDPVWCITADKKNNLWLTTNSKGVYKFDGKSFFHYSHKQGLSDKTVWKALCDSHGNMWFGTSGEGVFKYDGKSFTRFTVKDGLCDNTISNIMEDLSGNLWFASFGKGATEYDGKTFTTITQKEGLTDNDVSGLFIDREENVWLANGSGLNRISKKKLAQFNAAVKKGGVPLASVFFKNYTVENGFPAVGAGAGSITDDKGDIWISANKMLAVYHPAGEIADSLPPNIQLTDIRLFSEVIPWEKLENKKDTVFALSNGVKVSGFHFDSLSRWYDFPENLNLAHNDNYITFDFTGITMYSPKKVRYQYKLIGLDEDWNAITSRTEASYGNLPPDVYTFKVKAMNSGGIWSKEFSYTFTIRPPWWQTWWFRILAVSILIGSVVFYIKWRVQRLKVENEVLEEKVELRTNQLAEKTKIAEEQKQLIEEKHKEITDSINYAQRIQRSLLASDELLTVHLKEYFIFFRPKDIVSGDFHWATTLSNGNFALVTADSTGHGVPGAIMSILNTSCLKESVKEGLAKPADILNNTRKLIIETLKKDGSTEGGKDGMDCSLISFDFRNGTFTYAAANNPIWIVRGKEIIELTPDKMPVGKHDKDTISFTQHEVTLQEGDVIYAITDGMQDQFGGLRGKKFMVKQLKDLLVSNAHLPLNEQKNKLAEALNVWRGDLEQVDDITVIGIRI